jgi:dTDP-4-dehydrorhamnose reductase
MRVLVLGISGMLGHMVFQELHGSGHHDVWGTLRSGSLLSHFETNRHRRIRYNIDALDIDALTKVLAEVRPDVVVNCVGLIKQIAGAEDALTALPINAMLPHRLVALCKVAAARLIHISTDCVFSGSRGNYREDDVSDAYDLYGKSKHIGEICDVAHAITLRTSIIGHELSSQRALVDWFLSQEGSVKGYRHAIFSGLPTVELSRVIRDIVIPRSDLCGLYHVSAAPVAKYDLLRLIAAQYGKAIRIDPDDEITINRSLDSSRFQAATGYIAPAWQTLVAAMHASR